MNSNDVPYYEKRLAKQKDEIDRLKCSFGVLQDCLERSHRILVSGFVNPQEIFEKLDVETTKKLLKVCIAADVKTDLSGVYRDLTPFLLATAVRLSAMQEVES